jgi:hypothetical protein
VDKRERTADTKEPLKRRQDKEPEKSKESQVLRRERVLKRKPTYKQGKPLKTLEAY